MDVQDKRDFYHGEFSVCKLLIYKLVFFTLLLLSKAYG